MMLLTPSLHLFPLPSVVVLFVMVFVFLALFVLCFRAFIFLSIMFPLTTHSWCILLLFLYFSRLKYAILVGEGGEWS